MAKKGWYFYSDKRPKNLTHFFLWQMSKWLPQRGRFHGTWKLAASLLPWSSAQSTKAWLNVKHVFVIEPIWSGWQISVSFPGSVVFWKAKSDGWGGIAWVDRIISWMSWVKEGILESLRQIFTDFLVGDWNFILFVGLSGINSINIMNGLLG